MPESGFCRVWAWFDIDFHRQVLHVRQGKGKKDRYLPLGFMLVSIIKIYIDIYKPKTWLFGGKEHKNFNNISERKYGHRSIQSSVKYIAKCAGVINDITVHTLRHTYATHLLEDGLDIVSIKELLGHTKTETTLIYFHVAQVNKKDKVSPIDNLQGVKILQGFQSKINFSDVIA